MGSVEEDLRLELADAKRQISTLRQKLAHEDPLSPVDSSMAQALSAARLGAWSWDLRTNEVDWSERIGEIYGLQPGEFAGTYQGFLDLLDEPARAAVTQAIERTLRTGKPYFVEHSITVGPDDVRWLSSRGQLYYDEQGNPVKLLGAVADVTERKQSEQKLAESEERFRAFAEASFEGIVFSIDGRVVDSNDAACELFGYGREEMSELPVSKFVSAEDTSLVQENMSRAFPGVYQHRGVKKDGSTLFVEARGRKVTYKGKPARMTALRDVTEQRRLADEREQLEQQLRQAQKMEAVGQLAGGIAHDFNNILTAVLGNLALGLAQIKGGAPVTEILEDLEDAERCGFRAVELVAQLLTYSRKQPHHPQFVNLAETLTETEGMLRRLIREDVELQVQCRPSEQTVFIDPGHLQQVVMNLVVNAGDSMPNGGQLLIETQATHLTRGQSSLHPAAEGPVVILAIQDTGSGMSPAVLERVFEPFYTTKIRGQGTGLGLSMAYALIEQAGGHIGVHSELGVGSRFSVLLPAHASEAQVVRRAPSPLPGPGGEETVLVCEDDDDVRRFIVRVLGDAGYRVLDASTASEALKLAEATPAISLLVTDVIMPQMDGKHLSAQICRGNPHIRTLFCSGYSEDVISHRGVVDAGIELLVKPFTAESLLQTVRSVLDRKSV